MYNICFIYLFCTYTYIYIYIYTYVYTYLSLYIYFFSIQILSCKLSGGTYGDCLSCWYIIKLSKATAACIWTRRTLGTCFVGGLVFSNFGVRLVASQRFVFTKNIILFFLLLTILACFFIFLHEKDTQWKLIQINLKIRNIWWQIVKQIGKQPPLKLKSEYYVRWNTSVRSYRCHTKMAESVYLILLN